jgi:hypothetical protein
MGPSMFNLYYYLFTPSPLARSWGASFDLTSVDQSEMLDLLSHICHKLGFLFIYLMLPWLEMGVSRWITFSFNKVVFMALGVLLFRVEALFGRLYVLTSASSR